MKREARSRLAAARKQAKLRAQQEAAAQVENGGSPADSDSLNGSSTAETNEGGDDATTNEDSTCMNNSVDTSPNTSLNSTSNSSSVELLSNGIDGIDVTDAQVPAAVVVQPSIEVNGVAWAISQSNQKKNAATWISICL